VVSVVALLDDVLTAAGRVLLVLNRGGYQVHRLSLEPAPGGAVLEMEVGADDGGVRLVRQLTRIVSVVDCYMGASTRSRPTTCLPE
jgi:hypothetical protein